MTTPRRPDAMSFAEAVTTVAGAPRRFTFEAAVRLLDQGSGHPGVGKSLRPAEDPFRLGQRADPTFAAGGLCELTPSTAGPMLRTVFSGLLGQSGALPEPIVQRAFDRRQHLGDTALEDFADIFHHRFFSLLYRAWAEADPVVSEDRKANAAFPGYIASLLSLNAIDGAQAFTAPGRHAFSALLLSPVGRAEKAERLLASQLGVPVEIIPFSGTWLELPEENRARLGAPLADRCLGTSVFTRTSVYDVRIGPLTREPFENLLPGGAALTLVRETLAATIGLNLEARIRLLRCASDLTGARLGGGDRLGFETWVGSALDGQSAREEVALSGRMNREEEHYG